MQARIVASGNGARWLAEGFRLFRLAPFGWLLVVFLYLMFTQLLAVLPVIGLVSMVLVPAFTVGLMAGARAVARGAPLDVGLLFDGFRQNLRPQLVLGAIYLACAMLVLGGMRLADADGVWRSMFTGERKMEEVAFDDVLAPLAAFALLYTPVMMLFWFAPPLAAWNAAGAAKSLFFSFVACCINWRAFLVYGAALTLVAIALPLAAVGVLTVFSGSASRAALMALAVSFVFALLPTLFASFYASYRDVFGTEAAEPR